MGKHSEIVLWSLCVAATLSAVPSLPQFRTQPWTKPFTGLNQPIEPYTYYVNPQTWGHVAPRSGFEVSTTSPRSNDVQRVPNSGAIGLVPYDDSRVEFRDEYVPPFTALAATGNRTDFVNHAGSTSSSSVTNLGLQLLKVLAEENSVNAMISPLSIGAVLALLQQGSGGQSQAQLQNVLGLSAEESKNAYSAAIGSLKARVSKNTLLLENNIFVGTEFSINPIFKIIASRNFKAGIEPTNFKNPSVAAAQINRWANTATRGRIPTVVAPGSLDGTTQLILANAIYFKGLWTSPFAPERTVLQTFSTKPGVEEQAVFMHQSGSFNAGEDTSIGAKWLELPFEGNEYSALFILPTQQHQLDKLTQNLKASDLDAILSSRELRDVIMGIPKFKLSAEMDLVKALVKMGVRNIFTEQSGLEGLGTGNRPIAVSKVIHKVDMEIDEVGSRAAAVTALVANTLSLQGFNEDQFYFFANQPFLLMLIDKENRIPMFIAKVLSLNKK